MQGRFGAQASAAARPRAPSPPPVPARGGACPPLNLPWVAAKGVWQGDRGARTSGECPRFKESVDRQASQPVSVFSATAACSALLAAPHAAYCSQERSAGSEVGLGSVQERQAAVDRAAGALGALGLCHQVTERILNRLAACRGRQVAAADCHSHQRPGSARCFAPALASGCSRDLEAFQRGKLRHRRAVGPPRLPPAPTARPLPRSRPCSRAVCAPLRLPKRTGSNLIHRSSSGGHGAQLGWRRLTASS